MVEDDRAALLDATLDALLAGRTAVGVRGPLAEHARLAPTDAELTARAATYLRLLAHDAGPVVRIGLDAAARLAASGAVPPARVADALLTAALGARKGVALDAMRLLERLLAGPGATREDRALAARVARGALEASVPDVRLRARALLRRSAPEGSAAPGVTDEVAAPGPPPPPAGIDLAGLPPLLAFPAGRVLPVRDAEELADLLARLLEDAQDPVAVERALDGVLRCAGTRPRSAYALAARARERLPLAGGPWTGGDLRADVAALTLVWLGKRRAGRGRRGRQVGARRGFLGLGQVPVLAPDWSMTSLVELRLHEVARSVGRGPRCLLSLPTADDGSLDAVALTERLGGATSVPPLDLELAYLRVPPGQRAQVSGRVGLSGAAQVADALVHLARPAPVLRRDLRAVGPAGERQVGWADPGAPAGSQGSFIAGVLDRRDPLARADLEASDGASSLRPDQATALWPLALPHDADLLASHAHPRLHRALTANRSGAAPLVGALGRTSSPIGAPGASALVLALGAKETAVRLAGVDALVLRAGRGAADAGGLAAQLRLGLADDLVVGSRVVEALADVARVDLRTAALVLDVLVAVRDAVAARHDAYRWLRLLDDVSRRLGRTVPPAPTLGR